MIFLRFLFKNVNNNKNDQNNRLDVNNNQLLHSSMTSSINKLMEDIRRKETMKMSKIFKQYPHHSSIMDFRTTNGTNGGSGSTYCNSRPSGILLNMMPREEYEREKQRWANKLLESESELKLSEQTNSSLVQAKAELLKRLKDLEKVHKILQENYRKLLEKQKSIFVEARKSEEKFKQCHEANWNLKQNVEKISQEHCKANERKLRGEKQEEVERLKQQNLHYCKLIAGLKRSEHEKDRRIDILYQKINQLKKIQAKSHISAGCTFNNNNNGDDPVRSRDYEFSTQHEADWMKNSMTSLNTIVEDCSELSREELEASYRNLLKKVNIMQQQQQQTGDSTSSTLPSPTLLSTSSTFYHHSQENNNNQSSYYCHLGAKLLEANRKIAQLEKTLEAKSSASTNAADSVEWTQEKVKLISLTQNLQQKLDHVTSARDKFESDLQEQKEKNELLEFRLLEIENNANSLNENDDSYSDSSYCNNKSVCDRSVSTNDDEGFCSADCSSDELSETSDHFQHIFTADDLRIRLTLLKHRKDLKDADRLVIGQVKEEWEKLQSQHAGCKSIQTELELKCRETESLWKLKVDTLQTEVAKLEEKLSNTQRKLVRLKETKKDYEHLLNRYYKLQKVQAEANESIAKYKIELEKLQYILRYNRNHIPQSLNCYGYRSTISQQNDGATSSTMDVTCRFAMERAHLRKQLCQQKNYCRQLERQFEVQLATVKVLKDELQAVKFVPQQQKSVVTNFQRNKVTSANSQQMSTDLQQVSAVDQERPVVNKCQLIDNRRQVKVNSRPQLIVDHHLQIIVSNKRSLSENNISSF